MSFKVGDMVYVEIFGLSKRLVYKGVATIISKDSAVDWMTDKSEYPVIELMGDIIIPLTKLEKAMQ